MAGDSHHSPDSQLFTLAYLRTLHFSACNFRSPMSLRIATLRRARLFSVSITALDNFFAERQTHVGQITCEKGGTTRHVVHIRAENSQRELCLKIDRMQSRIARYCTITN